MPEELSFAPRSRFAPVNPTYIAAQRLSRNVSTMQREADDCSTCSEFPQVINPNRRKISQLVQNAGRRITIRRPCGRARLRGAPSVSERSAGRRPGRKNLSETFYRKQVYMGYIRPRALITPASAVTYYKPGDREGDYVPPRGIAAILAPRYRTEFHLAESRGSEARLARSIAR